MDFKNVNLVYFSATNVSKKYAEAMGKSLNKPVVTYDFTLPKNRDGVKLQSFTGDDLVILSYPVYGGRIPDICLNYIENLKGKDTPCILIATYGNRDFDDALVEAEDIMSERGFIIVGRRAVVGTHSFSRDIAPGRPNREDLEGAAKFAQIVAGKELKALEKGIIPGNRPYKEKNSTPNTMMPVTDDNCIDCKACALRCPAGVISVENPKLRVKDASACLRCHRCVVYCPKKAIHFEGEVYEKMVQSCIARFGSPDKENKYFM